MSTDIAALRFWVHSFLSLLSLIGLIGFWWLQKRKLPPFEVKNSSWKERVVWFFSFYSRKIFLWIENLEWEKKAHKILVHFKIYVLKIESFLNQRIYDIRKRVREKEETQRYWESIRKYLYKPQDKKPE